jgi:hypothetical protein
MKSRSKWQRREQLTRIRSRPTKTDDHEPPVSA